jgi:hypothetical protein
VTKIPTLSAAYRMIELSFVGHPAKTSDITSIGVKQTYRNNRLTRYETTLSIVLFIISGFTSTAYYRKFKQDANPGDVKKVIAVALTLLPAFNFPYKYNLTTNTLTAIYDTFINSSTIATMFFCNLVIVHSLSFPLRGPPKSKFYRPKALTTLVLFICLSVWCYSDFQADLDFLNNGFQYTESTGKWQFTLLLLAFGVYMGFLVQYSWRAISFTQRFDHVTRVVLLCSAIISSAIVVIPYRSQTLTYISVNGVVNIYLILIGFLFEPYVESDIKKYQETDGGKLCQEDSMNTREKYIELETLESP